MENIFSVMDPLSWQRAHNVNKYWRSIASKNRIKKIILERYVNS